LATKEGDAETRVTDFYGSIGWETNDEVTEDARLWEDLREHAASYVSRCRLRVLRHIPEHGRYLLDMASGPIQYPEYLEFSKNFEKRYCVDLSEKALDAARSRIGDHGVFLHGSFFDIDVDDNFFDCAVSLHTIYHMDRDRQEEAVRKLLRVTKVGKPVIVVYSNPFTVIDGFGIPRKIRRTIGRWVRPSRKSERGVYFHAHPLGWWDRFSEVADVRILPWRAFAAHHQKRFFPDSPFGERMLDRLFRLEDRFPGLFVRLFQYPMIVLVKRSSDYSGKAG
jgi:ubiquinone/menaquinone biosynthesis C-methylase UbiE